MRTALLGFLTLDGNAQNRKQWEFPVELRPSLNARIRRFTRAQAAGRWDTVATLLGRYRHGDDDDPLAYTPEHKACLLSQMKTSAMTRFEFKVYDSSFSSAILFTPLGRKWWTLVGQGEFRGGVVSVKRAATVVAYRDGGEWYFTPFIINDNEWAKANMTADEIAMDRNGQVELPMEADSPLEIVNLHVFADPDHPATRHIRFRLHNKTARQIKGYSFKIGDSHERGDISVGAGDPRDAIKPSGVSREWVEDDVAYTYWCEGEPTMRIEIQDVNFADDSEWMSPSFRKELNEAK